MRKVLISVLIIVLIAALFLPYTQNAQASVTTELNQGQKKALEKQLFAIAKQTYKYFETFTDPETGLTLDRIDLENGTVVEYTHTSPTNIGMYLLSTISAAELGIISEAEAKEKIKTTLQTLEQQDTWNGLFYNWYYTSDGSLKTDWGKFISTVDNGWLTAALIVVGQAYPELQELTVPLINAMDYSHLYDQQVGQFHGGYDVLRQTLTEFHYGMFYTEPRVASYIAIGKGDVPVEHWWRMYRTLPKEWDWQRQIPQGYFEYYDGVEVFQGHYEYKGVKFVPSWGGSMFEALMPSLVLKENELGTKALGINNKRHVQLQIAYAEEKGYPAWGFSPAAIPNGYSEFGVAELGTWGYDDKATVTPHATFLALDHAPDKVWENIKYLRSLNAYGPFGFYDSVNMETGVVAKTYLALDQGMTIVAIANYLLDGVIRNYFHQDSIGKIPEHLLYRERFSILD
ncbi:hypothetical protein J2S00_001454 [Caldalkalibacillus uzonensis]|uniref:Glycoamylase-like domain-containing protein n=1 Tax=Caldalkalibacillus uzonensis TaxID=353224 RepID=A0ABU0CQH8_9BACI|nr:glucoamylase family protein [Caldalkalibacillus uzonensis]MDQ0338668.1 hypothetical protein [Caldalkalibacillus uzonensis]